MTVAQLIAELQRHPPEAEVLVDQSRDFHQLGDATQVQGGPMIASRAGWVWIKENDPYALPYSKYKVLIT